MLQLRVALMTGRVVVCTTNSAWVFMREWPALVEVEFTMALGNLLVVLLRLILVLGIAEMIA